MTEIPSVRATTIAVVKARFARPFVLGVGLLVVAACGGDGPEADSAGASVTRGLLSARSMENGPPAVRGPDGQEVEGGMVPLPELGFNRGSAQAPVRVIELSDYGCGYCRRFHLETFPSLRQEFVDAGIVEWKFLPYVTGMFDNSMAAVQAAECALEQSPDAFEALNERLWHEQSEWKGSGDAASVVRRWAVEAGVETLSFDSCVSQGRRLDRIATAGVVARDLGVRGTPTFIVVGYGPLQGALPLDTFRDILRAVHREAVSGE